MNINSRNVINEERAKYNKGDVFEFVISAAMVARFTDRYDDGTAMPLTAQSVEDVMAQYFAGNRQWEVDEGDDQVDVVLFDTAALPGAALVQLNTPGYRGSKEVQDMVKSSLSAVKRGTIGDLADDVISNNRPDNVVIRPVGTLAQSATKSDVDVYVNGTEVRRAGISLKYETKKETQIAQFSGRDSVQSLRSAFATFGIEVKPALKAVEKAVSQLGGVYTGRDDPLITKDKAIMFPAVRSVFDFVSKKFSGNWLANVRNAATLADGFIKAGRGQEEDVEIIKGSGSKSITFNRATFEALKRGLATSAKNKAIIWRIGQEGGNPKIILVADGLEVFSIRFRYDADSNKDKTQYRVRFRTYVQTGKELPAFIEKY